MHVPKWVPFALIQSMANMHTPSTPDRRTTHGKCLIFLPDWIWTNTIWMNKKRNWNLVMLANIFLAKLTASFELNWWWLWGVKIQKSQKIFHSFIFVLTFEYSERHSNLKIAMRAFLSLSFGKRFYGIVKKLQSNLTQSKPTIRWKICHYVIRIKVVKIHSDFIFSL